MPTTLGLPGRFVVEDVRLMAEATETFVCSLFKRVLAKLNGWNFDRLLSNFTNRVLGDCKLA